MGRAGQHAPPPIALRPLWDFSDPAASEQRFQELRPTAEESWSLSAQAELLSQVARAQGLATRYADAHGTLDRALALAESRRAEAWVEIERGRVLRSNGAPGAAEPHFERALDLAREASEDALTADALHMLAIVDPTAWRERAIAFSVASDDPDVRRWLGPLYHNTWLEHVQSGRLDEALVWARRAHEFRLERADAEGERIARWCICHTLRKRGDFEDALSGLRELLSGYGDDGDPSGYTQEELGECLLALGRATEARVHFKEAHAKLSQVAAIVASEPERIERLGMLAGDDPDHRE